MPSSGRVKRSIHLFSVQCYQFTIFSYFLVITQCIYSTLQLTVSTGQFISFQYKKVHSNSIRFKNPVQKVPFSSWKQINSKKSFILCQYQVMVPAVVGRQTWRDMFRSCIPMLVISFTTAICRCLHLTIYGSHHIWQHQQNNSSQFSTTQFISFRWQSIYLMTVWLRCVSTQHIPIKGSSHIHSINYTANSSAHFDSVHRQNSVQFNPIRVV